MRVTRFKADHLVALPELVDGPNRLTPEQGHLFEQFTAFTVIDEYPLMCVGAIPLKPTVAELWAAVSVDFKAHPERRQVFAPLKALIRNHAIQHDLNRIQGSVPTGWGDGATWMHLLGMRYESTMVAYGSQGEDHDRYVWITKEHVNG